MSVCLSLSLSHTHTHTHIYMHTIHEAEQMKHCTHFNLVCSPILVTHSVESWQPKQKNNVLSHGRTATFPYIGNAEKKTPWADQQAGPTLYLHKRTYNLCYWTTESAHIAWLSYTSVITRELHTFSHVINNGFLTFPEKTRPKA
jgi:hypothetical protein